MDCGVDVFVEVQLMVDFNAKVFYRRIPLDAGIFDFELQGICSRFVGEHNCRGFEGVDCDSPVMKPSFGHVNL